MVKRFLLIVAMALACTTLTLAQNTNSSTTRTRTVAPKPSPTPKPAAKSTNPEAGTATQKPKGTQSAGQVGPSSAVQAAFNRILDGIRHSNVDMNTGGYWKSASLILFNFNGSVTKGWDQMRKNRETSYPEMKDVKLDVKDLRITILGRDAALITCQWTESMTFRGTPETDSGRMTIVFRKVGKDWKAIHLHTSNDHPDPSRIPASEQSPSP